MEDQVGSGRGGDGRRRRRGRTRRFPLSSPSEKLLEAAAAATAVADRFWCRRHRRRRRRCSFWEKSHSTKCLRRVGRGSDATEEDEKRLGRRTHSGASPLTKGRESPISKQNLIGGRFGAPSQETSLLAPLGHVSVERRPSCADERASERVSEHACALLS